MSTGGNLPADIISEILLRLPTKSLGRFKLVSKSWRALISDPKFTKTHLKFNCSRCPRLLFSDRHQFFQVVDIDYDGEQPYLSLSKIEFKESHLWINIRGSCNGLVFVQTMINSHLFLLNPTTRECKKLPNLIDVNFNASIYYGLGYDSTSDDYKVVIYNVGVVNVYSLRSDAWKMVQASPFGNNGVLIHDPPGISLNDSIHWICHCVSLSSVSIVAFDLAHENFKIVPHPRAFHPLAGYLMLYEVGGCLYLFKDHSQEIDVWIMKDYGVESSWTKFGRVTTGTVEGLYFYSIFYLSDKELVSMHRETREIKIVTCNVKEKTSRSVTLDGVGRPYYFVSTFLDSLVSPQQFNRPGQQHSSTEVITSKDLRQ